MQLHGRLQRTISALGISMALAAALAPGAMASSATIVEGIQAPDAGNACTDNPDAVVTYTMSGSLVGCWYLDTAEYKNVSRTGVLVTGTEHFVGCLGATCGTLSTTFSFTAKYDGDTEVHGRCYHPITGGTGGFAGASGSLTFKDEPSGCATYHGVVRL